MLPWFSTPWTTSRRSPPFLRFHHIEDWPGILLIRQNGKPHYLLKKSTLTEDISKQLRPTGSRLNGLPKIHKEGVPLRRNCQQHWRSYLPTLQVVSRTSQPTHREFGTPCKNSFQVVQTLIYLRVQPEDLMVSFDVVSLFTKVLIVDSLELLS